MEKYLKKPGCGILAVTKRVLSATTRKKAAAQTRKKTLFIVSEKVTFVLINATRIIRETIGAKFTKKRSLAVEKLNTIEYLLYYNHFILTILFIII